LSRSIFIVVYILLNLCVHKNITIMYINTAWVGLMVKNMCFLLRGHRPYTIGKTHFWKLLFTHLFLEASIYSFSLLKEPHQESKSSVAKLKWNMKMSMFSRHPCSYRYNLNIEETTSMFIPIQHEYWRASYIWYCTPQTWR
jgi:hypothetical protein